MVHSDNKPQPSAGHFPAEADARADYPITSDRSGHADFPAVGKWPAPLRAERLRLIQASPLCRATGIEILEWGCGRAVTRMAASERVSQAPGDLHIDRLALVPLLDDAFSNAIASAVPLAVGMSTLDLTINFGGDEPPRGFVLADTRVVQLERSCATAISIARDETGRTVASGRALFSLDGFPGGKPPDFGRVGQYDPATASGPFRTLLGLSIEEDRVALPGGNPHIVGWETGNTLHGGATGSLLMAACQQVAATHGEDGKMLLSFAVRYLRPAVADLPLLTDGEVERRGRAASFVTANCFNGTGRDVARASATFVRSAED